MAAGLVPFAIGTETWGSITTPASYCGLTGLRPTYGRVSRAGAMALAWTHDKIGPMARDAHDCGQVLARFVVHGDAVTARCRECLEVLLRAFGHQMAVDEAAGVVDLLRDRLEHDRPDRDRLDEVSVTCVEMEDLHARAHERVDLVAEIGEVARVERRLDLDRPHPVVPRHRLSLSR